MIKYDEIILDHVVKLKDHDNRYAFKNIERGHTLTKYKPKCYFQGKRLKIGQKGVIATINKPIKTFKQSRWRNSYVQLYLEISIQKYYLLA